MKTIANPQKKTDKQQPPARPAPASIRADPEFLQRVTDAAAAIGYSQNAFAVAALEGIIEMIETPAGEPLKEPKIVAMARFIRSWEPNVVQFKKKP